MLARRTKPFKSVGWAKLVATKMLGWECSRSENLTLIFTRGRGKCVLDKSMAFFEVQFDLDVYCKIDKCD